jgi:hypothetical protein
MPKGPNGQKRPADAIGCAVHVAKIATGEIEESPIEQKGSVGGKARAAKLSPSKRSEIARLAARRRWQEKGTNMTQTAGRESEAATSGRQAVRMYPSNQLKDQVRDFGSNLSAFAVMKDAFAETE